MSIKLFQAMFQYDQFQARTDAKFREYLKWALEQIESFEWQKPTLVNVEREIYCHPDIHPLAAQAWEAMADKPRFCKKYETAREAAVDFVRKYPKPPPNNKNYNELCLDCDKDVFELGEYAYMVHDHVWLEAAARTGKGYGKLCVECLEVRLGRPLVQTDFNWILPLNWARGYARSKRLVQRLKLTSDLQDALYELYPEDQWGSRGDKSYNPEGDYLRRAAKRIVKKRKMLATA